MPLVVASVRFKQFSCTLGSAHISQRRKMMLASIHGTNKWREKPPPTVFMLLWCSLSHHFCSRLYIRVIYWIRHISFSLCRVCCEWYCGWQWLASPRISLQSVSQWGSAGSARPAERKHKNTLKSQRSTSTANGIENRTASLNCWMLDVSPQTL